LVIPLVIWLAVNLAGVAWAKSLGTALFVLIVLLYATTSIAITRFRCPRCDSFFHGPRRSFVPPAKCDTCGIEIGTPAPPRQLDDGKRERS
jgi:hypothetical protein